MIALGEAVSLLEGMVAALGAERLAVADALGRVLALGVAGVDGPARTAIDGFAVRAGETEGASEYAPLPLAAVAVVAGVTVPAGMDAVLPGHWFEGGCALAAVAPGHGVTVADGRGVAGGTRLRPMHLAVLAGLGVTAVDVVRRPVVALRVAGPKEGPEALAAMLRGWVAAEGGVAGSGSADLVVHAGRSGPGADDDGIAAFDVVAAHGVAIRPGESAAIGRVGRVPALLLPGEPVACAAAFALLAGPALRRLAGRAEAAPTRARLARKIVSGLGQADLAWVRVAAGEAVPVGAALAAAADADGFVLVPADSEGFNAGADVAIFALP